MLPDFIAFEFKDVAKQALLAREGGARASNRARACGGVAGGEDCAGEEALRWSERSPRRKRESSGAH